LADAIATVRRELERAVDEGRDAPLAFRAGPVELEFAVAFSASGSAQGGVRAWVLTAGAKAELMEKTSHRVRISLAPVDRATGADQIIGDVGDR
jgi:hypothetical protein